MLDEIEEISGSDEIEFFSRFCKFLVELYHSTMHSNNSVDKHRMSSIIFLHRRVERLGNWVNYHCELFSDLIKSFL